MTEDHCFVYFTDASFDLSSATTALKGCGLTVNFVPGQHFDQLVVFNPHSPKLRVAFSIGDDVKEEASGLAALSGESFSNELSQCNRRYEIMIDDLDSVLEEINTLIEVQHTLQTLTHGYLYLNWNGYVTAPD